MIRLWFPSSVLTGTNSSPSCPLPGAVRFKGRGSGGGRGSGLGEDREDTFGKVDDSRSAPTGDESPLTKHPQSQNLAKTLIITFITDNANRVFNIRWITGCWGLILSLIDLRNKKLSACCHPDDHCCRSVPVLGCYRRSGKHSAPSSACCSPQSLRWKLLPPPHHHRCCRCSCCVGQGFCVAASPGRLPQGPVSYSLEQTWAFLSSSWALQMSLVSF